MAERRTGTARRGNRRLRVVLFGVLAVLLLLLLGLSAFFVTILRPVESRIDATAPESTDLEWVRSMYGFGPSAEEQLLSPTSVAIAPDGRVYASDPQRSRIMIFQPDGTFDSLLHTGAGGTTEGMFSRPESMDVADNGDVYICDFFSPKMIVFDENGEYLREWRLENDVPRGVDIVGNRAFILGGGKVYLYDLQGNQLGSFGTRGRAPGNIDAYQGIVSDGERIFIADALNQRMQALDTTGEAIWVNPDPEAMDETGPTEESESEDAPYDLPQDVVIDGNGRLVAIDAFKFEIVVSDPDTGEVLERYGTDGTADGTFFYPTGIDYDPDRDWFAIADTRNDRVQIVRIPGSGDSGQATVRRILTSPWRYCAIPLILLLLALVIAVVSRRRSRFKYEDEMTDINTEDS